MEKPKGPWGNGEPLTMEELKSMFKKVCKEHLRYTYSMCIGFVDNRAIDDETVWIVKYDAFRQNGKSIVLTKAGSNLHKLIRQIEDEEDIRFDRLNDDTMRAIQQNCKILFTDEDGRYKSLLEPIDPMKITMNPLAPDKEAINADFLCMGAEIRLIDLINN